MPYNSVELITSHWRAFLPFNSRCHGGCETFANLNSYKFNSGAGKSAISYTETAIIRGIPRKSFSLCGSFEATKWTSFTCAAHAENFWPTILGNTKRLQNEVFIISFQLLTCCDSWSSGYNGLYTKHAYAREGFASLKKKTVFTDLSLRCLSEERSALWGVYVSFSLGAPKRVVAALYAARYCSHTKSLSKDGELLAKNSGLLPPS